MALAVFIALAILPASPGRARESLSPPCRVAAELERVQIRLPSRGLNWAKGETDEGSCDPVPAKRWIRGASGVVDLMIDADGPHGSGRYWNVTIGLAERHEAEPSRGVCLQTTTIGWRTLLEYKPLAWLVDVNGDGKMEIVIWSSFPLRDSAAPSEQGLIAWVYGLNEDELSLDWALTRRLAHEVAGAYRRPIRGDQALAQSRKMAAEALEAFAERRCGANAR